MNNNEDRMFDLPRLFQDSKPNDYVSAGLLCGSRDYEENEALV
jgi:hypothetical protein